MNKHGRFYSFNLRTTSFSAARERKKLTCELQLRRKRLSLFFRNSDTAASQTVARITTSTP